MYKEPEQTDEYWYGIWDFIYSHFPEGKDRTWVLESPFFEGLAYNYADMIFDDLNDWYKQGLVEKELFDFVASRVEGGDVNSV